MCQQLTVKTQLKRTRKEATDAAKLETTATKAATAEYVKGAAAAKQYSSSRGFVGLNNARTGMMGMGGGAGTKILGGAMVAQGLIGSATDTGNQAGNILATIGGAAMFSGNPGIMAAGAVASIAGTALNAINAAEEAKKQQRLSVIADRVQLDAQVVNTAAERANTEILQIIREGLAPNTAAAAAIVAERSQIATESANEAIAAYRGKGGVLDGAATAKVGDTTSAVRTALAMSGKVKAADMPAILDAVANTALSTPNIDANALAEAVLAAYGSKKNLAAVTNKFGKVADTVTEQTTMPGESLPTTRIVPIAQTTANQVAKIIPSMIKGDANMFKAGIAGTNQTQMILNTSALQSAGISKEAVSKFLGSSKGKNLDTGVKEALDAYVKDIVVSSTNLTGLRNAQGRKYEVFDPTKEGLKSTATTDPFNKRYGLTGFNPAQMPFGSNTQNRGFFLSNQVQSNKPAKVEILPTAKEIADTKLGIDVNKNTNIILNKLANTVDSTGQYLLIKDESKTDKVAPQIQIPLVGIGPAERRQYELLNEAIRAAFIAGGQEI